MRLPHCTHRGIVGARHVLPHCPALSAGAGRPNAEAPSETILGSWDPCNLPWTKLLKSKNQETKLTSEFNVQVNLCRVAGGRARSSVYGARVCPGTARRTEVSVSVHLDAIAAARRRERAPSPDRPAEDGGPCFAARGRKGTLRLHTAAAPRRQSDRLVHRCALMI